MNGFLVTYSVYLFLWQVKWKIFHRCQECSVAASLLNFLNLLFVPAIIDNRIAGRDYRYDDAIQVSSFYLPSNTVVFEKLVLPFSSFMSPNALLVCITDLPCSRSFSSSSHSQFIRGKVCTQIHQLLVL